MRISDWSSDVCSSDLMNYEEMLTWLLFYTSIFRTGKLPMVDVVDPAGLVRSLVVESDDGSLRLTLNGAETRKPLTGHFITDSLDRTSVVSVRSVAVRVALGGSRTIHIQKQTVR